MLFTQLKEELATAHVTDEKEVIGWLIRRNPGIEREAISISMFKSLIDDYTEAQQNCLQCYTKGGLPWFFVRQGNKVLLVSAFIIPVMLYELVEC